MNGERCHACGRKVSDRNRATLTVGGCVGGCVACSDDGASVVKAQMLTRSLETADGLGYVPTRLARYIRRPYRAA